ncbi:hypothetical protein BaRGS_00028447, partial [Batillaria attramentaria]
LRVGVAHSDCRSSMNTMMDLDRGKKFVGRHAERLEVKTRLAKGERVLLLYGQPMVGKASLAKQVAEELCAENPHQLVTVDCKAAFDWPDVMKTLCSGLSLDEANPIETVLLEAHHVNEVARFLSSLAEYDVTTIVTSRHFLQLRRACAMEVKPLSQDDAMQLLRQDVVNAETEDFADILKHCRGLPPLVLRLGQLLSGDSVLTNTRDDLKQLLSQEAERLFEGLSQEVQGHVTTLTQLLGGSFSEEALVAALGVKQSRGQTVLRRLCEESSAVFDPTLRRVHIKPLVMFHVRRFGHVDADDQARLRVVTFVGRVLVRAERELYLQDLDTVYGYVQGEWPQLQHVLRQAIHCTGDTFHAFLKVAMQAESLLVRCFPEEATDFFRKLAAAAVTFGKPRDQAMLQGMIGMAGTQCAEMTGWQEALDCFDRALPEVRKDPRSPFLPRLLCFIGSTYFRLSQMQKAQEFLTEAWKACEMTEAEEEKVVFLLILIRSLLALPIIFTGHLSEGKELVLKTLELVDKQPYRHHPHRPVLINTLGIVYERSGEDQEKALHYYEQSLAARRPFAKVAPRDLIAPLHNIAMQHCRRGNYDKALTLLYESADIMRDTPHSSTAMTHENLGYVYLLKARSEFEVNSTRACNYFKQAGQHFLEAARIHAMLSPLQDGRMKLALFMAHVYVTPPCRDVMQVKNYLRQACDVLENDGDDLTNQGLLMAMSAVQHRLQLDGWQAGSKHLLKLARQCLEDKGAESKQLSTQRNVLETVLTRGPIATEEERNLLMSSVLKQCSACDYLGLQNAAKFWRAVEGKARTVRETRKELMNLGSAIAVLNKPKTRDRCKTSSPEDQEQKAIGDYKSGKMQDETAGTSRETAREDRHDGSSAHAQFGRDKQEEFQTPAPSRVDDRYQASHFHSQTLPKATMHQHGSSDQTLPGLPVMPFGALGIPGQQIPGLNLVPGHGTSASSWTREGNIYYQYCHTDSRPVVNITNNVTTSVNIRKMEGSMEFASIHSEPQTPQTPCDDPCGANPIRFHRERRNGPRLPAEASNACEPQIGRSSSEGFVVCSQEAAGRLQDTAAMPGHSGLLKITGHRIVQKIARIDREDEPFTVGLEHGWAILCAEPATPLSLQNTA